jgi:hypothetical protein
MLARTYAGEPSALFKVFVRYEGVLLAGVFVTLICKLGLDIYSEERFEEGQRKLQLEARYLAAHQAALSKIRELEVSFLRLRKTRKLPKVLLGPIPPLTVHALCLPG